MTESGHASGDQTTRIMEFIDRLFEAYPWDHPPGEPLTARCKWRLIMGALGHSRLHDG